MGLGRILLSQLSATIQVGYGLSTLYTYTVYIHVRFIFGRRTYPISLLILFFFFFCGDFFKMLCRLKSDQDEIWQGGYTLDQINDDGTSSKYRHRLTGRIFDLTSHLQDGGYDIISRRKVLPSGECRRRLLHMQPASNCVYFWSIVHS